MEELNAIGVPDEGIFFISSTGTHRNQIKALPNRDEITLPIQEQLIVELYSK